MIEMEILFFWKSKSAIIFVVLALPLISLITGLSRSIQCTDVKDVAVVEGGDAELFCKIRNEPSNNITYYLKKWNFITKPDFGGRHVYIMTSLDGSGRPGFSYMGRVEKLNKNIVKLKNVTQQDAGTYFCNWEMSPEVPGCFFDEVKFTLKVIDPVSFVRATVTSGKMEGDNTTFRCSAAGTTPITYTWQKVAGGLPSGGRWRDDRNGTVTLSNIHRADDGWYTCTADNLAHQSKTSGKLRLEVYYAPRYLNLTSSSPSFKQPENTYISMTCTADGGNPSPYVRIYRGSSIAQSGRSSVVLTTRLLKFDNLRAFVCRATSAGISGEMTSNQVIYDVLFKPRNINVKESPSGSVEVNGTKYLTCSIDIANPPALVTWKRNGVTAMDHVTVTNPDGDNNAKKTSSVISIKPTRGHNGDEYGCVVKYSGKEITTLKRIFKINVTYAAKKDPRVTHKHIIITEYNETISFSLSVIANPGPRFNWSRVYDHVAMPLLGKSIVTVDGLNSKLTIPDSSKQDMVIYICSVNNAIGTSIFTFHLAPAASPNPPTEEGILNVTAISITLKWKSNFNGGFTQTFSIIYRNAVLSWPEKPQIIGIPDPGESMVVMYKVGNLSPDTTYEFRVRAINARSRGENRSLFTNILSEKTRGERSSKARSSPVGAVVGVVLAVIVVLIVASIIVYRRRKGVKEECKDKRKEICYQDGGVTDDIYVYSTESDGNLPKVIQEITSEIQMTAVQSTSEVVYERVEEYAGIGDYKSSANEYDQLERKRPTNREGDDCDQLYMNSAHVQIRKEDHTYQNFLSSPVATNDTATDTGNV